MSEATPKREPTGDILTLSLPKGRDLLLTVVTNTYSKQKRPQRAAFLIDQSNADYCLAPAPGVMIFLPALFDVETFCVAVDPTFGGSGCGFSDTLLAVDVEPTFPCFGGKGWGFNATLGR